MVDVVAGEGRTLLVLDDDAPLRTTLARCFERRGYRVLEARDHDEALAHITGSKPRVALLDLIVPGGSTIDLIHSLRLVRPDAHIVVMSSFESTDSVRACYEAGAARCRAKPFDLSEITACVDGDSEPAKLALPAPRIPKPNEVKRDYIRRVVAACDGNRSEAARKLGVQRQSVQHALGRGTDDDER